MNTKIVIGAGLAAALLAGAPASAGVYQDDLTRCVVKSTSETDKGVLVQFIFAAMAADPAVKTMSAVTEAQRSLLSRHFAEIEQRLMFTDCRSEAVAALKNEGTSVVEQSFSVLGQVAMRGLMSGPGIQAVMKDMASNMNKDKWVALFKEAGVVASISSGAK